MQGPICVSFYIFCCGAGLSKTSKTAGSKDVAGGGWEGIPVRTRACSAELLEVPVVLRALRVPNAGLARPQVLSLSCIHHGEFDF